MQSCIEHLQRGDIIHYKGFRSDEGTVAFDRWRTFPTRFYSIDDSPDTETYWLIGTMRVTKIVKFKK